MAKRHPMGERRKSCAADVAEDPSETLGWARPRRRLGQAGRLGLVIPLLAGLSCGDEAYQVYLNKAGSGQGEVRVFVGKEVDPADPPSLRCAAACEDASTDVANEADGSRGPIKLEAFPAPGSRFDGWVCDELESTDERAVFNKLRSQRNRNTQNPLSRAITLSTHKSGGLFCVAWFTREGDPPLGDAGVEPDSGPLPDGISDNPDAHFDFGDFGALPDLPNPREGGVGDRNGPRTDLEQMSDSEPNRLFPAHIDFSSLKGTYGHEIFMLPMVDGMTGTAIAGAQTKLTTEGSAASYEGNGDRTFTCWSSGCLMRFEVPGHAIVGVNFEIAHKGCQTGGTNCVTIELYDENGLPAGQQTTLSATPDHEGFSWDVQGQPRTISYFLLKGGPFQIADRPVLDLIKRP